MAVTPNYSWPVPDDTDLVKDGAEAIRDLGNAIDTTVDSLPSGGLVHIETQTFSSVAAVSFSNNVFNASHNNYKLVINFTSSGNELFWRARSAGSDISTSNYIWFKGLYNSNLSPGTSFVGSNGLTTWGALGNPSGSTVIEADFIGIFSSQKAASVFRGTREDGATGIAHIFGGSGMNLTTSYDSMSLLLSSGSMSGAASLYGYRI